MNVALSLAIGIILILTGTLNIIFFDRNLKRLSEKGKKPTENAQRLSKFLSVATFIFGLYITFGTLNNL